MKIKKILLKVPNIIRHFLYDEIKQDIKQLKNDSKIIHNELKNNRLETQKIAICSEELPLSERISIGKDYLRNGGNGAIKVKLKVLEEKYEQELKKGECKNV